MSSRIQDKYDIVLSDLENFANSLKDFFELKSSEHIKYFVYFLTIESGKHSARPVEVEKCFDLLHLSAYSNIPLYLSNQASGRNSIFIKNSKGYLLERTKRNKIQKEVGKSTKPKPTNNLFPLTLVEDTRGYVREMAHQAIICYDLKLYDASFVMIRKLLETLIIESFERHNLQEKIKTENGDYFFLRDLISKFLDEKTWKIGRETENGLPKIKQLADQSAHSRRFVAQKSDIENLKHEIRLSIQEIISLIDYNAWNKELSSN